MLHNNTARNPLRNCMCQRRFSTWTPYNYRSTWGQNPNGKRLKSVLTAFVVSVPRSSSFALLVWDFDSYCCTVEFGSLFGSCGIINMCRIDEIPQIGYCAAVPVPARPTRNCCRLPSSYVNLAITKASPVRWSDEEHMSSSQSGSTPLNFVIPVGLSYVPLVVHQRITPGQQISLVHF